MNAIATLSAATAALVLTAVAGAAEVREDTQVQILSNGSVIATTNLPAGAKLVINAQSGTDDVVHHTATYSGDAVLVASRDGKEIATLHGDQLIVTSMAHP